MTFSAKMNRRAALGLLAGGLVAGTAPRRVAAATTLNIGYPKAGPLIVLSKLGRVEKRLEPLGVSVQWREFTSGVQALEALDAGAIDFAMTGDSPPIFAQAKGTKFFYAGYEPAAPKSQGIIVLKSSGIASVADLKGKRIAVQRGSNCHYLTVAALKKAGIGTGDVKFEFMIAPDGRVALEGKNVDAYAVWDPLMTATIAGGNAQLLVDGVGLSGNHFYYSATAALAANHELLVPLFEEVSNVGLWINANRKETAALLAPATGLPAEIWEKALTHSEFGAKRIDAEPLQEQQRIADTFVEIGILPKPVRVADLVPSVVVR